MNKTFSENQLKEKAAKVFEKYPLAKQVFATTDGNVFLMKNRAELHSKGKIYTFDRPGDASAEESKGSDEPKLLTKAADIIEFIGKAKDLKSIEPYKADTRVTVGQAYNVKAEELAKKLEVNE